MAMHEFHWRMIQEQIQQAVEDLLQGRQAFQIYPSEQIKQPVYIPPIVDDAGLDIYNRMPEHIKQEIRENIHRYLEQVQRDYPPESRVEAT